MPALQQEHEIRIGETAVLARHGETDQNTIEDREDLGEIVTKEEK